MLAISSEEAIELRELRWQVGNYRSLHARALEREKLLKWTIETLEERVLRQEERIKTLLSENEKLKARQAWLEQQLFGRKSEQTQSSGCENPPGDTEVSGTGDDAGTQRKKRGKQPGAQGHGRKRRTELPTETVLHDLPPDQQRCPKCGKPFEMFPGTADSDEIDWEVRLVRRVHQRTRYRPACDCHAVAGIVAAPPPPKLIPKGMFSCCFWVRILLEKFLFQRPLYRVRMALALEGLNVSQGTLTGGLKRIEELLQPL